MSTEMQGVEYNTKSQDVKGIKLYLPTARKHIEKKKTTLTLLS